MDSIASFHQATEGHYITMLPADWLTSHDTFALQFPWRKMLWDLSIGQVQQWRCSKLHFS